MAASRAMSQTRLVNRSTGDPVLYLDYPGSHDAILFDGGENSGLTKDELGDLEAVFLTHHHIDHFIGLDRIVRANLDSDKILSIFGPIHTIQRVYDRVKSYEHPFFPFMQLTMRVHELLPGTIRIGDITCADRFAPPTITERPWKGRVCYETDQLQVESVAVDHTVPCQAYALVERGGFHPDPEKLAQGALRPGVWVSEVLELLRQGAEPTTTLEIQGGRFQLGKLAEHYFQSTTGARITYITDTFWSESVRADLVKLAKGSWRLYCDSFYARAQTKEAAKHRHMQSHQAAELAKLAKVDQLTLIHFSTRYTGRYGQLVDEAAAVFPRVNADLG